MKINIYIIDENGETHKLNRSEILNIESVPELKKDYDTILQRGMSDSFEVYFKTPKTTIRSLLLTIMPNNWLKRHGYPMRRKGGRFL